MIFQEPNGTFCNQYGFISGRVTPTTGSFATLEEAEKQLYADRPMAQKVQTQEKPPAHVPAGRSETQRRYQVVVYHHLENGMDEKLEYATPEEAEQAARAIWKARWNRTALPTRVRLSTTCWRRSGSA